MLAAATYNYACDFRLRNQCSRLPGLVAEEDVDMLIVVQVVQELPKTLARRQNILPGGDTTHPTEAIMHKNPET